MSFRMVSSDRLVALFTFLLHEMPFKRTLLHGGGSKPTSSDLVENVFDPICILFY